MYASANGLNRIALAIASSADGTEALRTLVSQGDGFTTSDVATLAHLGDASARRAFSRLVTTSGSASRASSTP